MICQHISIQTARYGASSTCSNCDQPIIFDGDRWQWEFGIARDKVSKMRRAYGIDRATGKHSAADAAAGAA